MLLEQIKDNSNISPQKLAKLLRTTVAEVSDTLGVGVDALRRIERAKTVKSQMRLRLLVEVLNKVEPRFGNPLLAYAWFRSQPLPGFDNMTPMQLVAEGRQKELLNYIDAIDAGVYA